MIDHVCPLYQHRRRKDTCVLRTVLRQVASQQPLEQPHLEDADPEQRSVVQTASQPNEPPEMQADELYHAGLEHYEAVHS